MPAGQIIGRASVKILPDTSDFKGQAKRELERIEKGLKVNVQAVFDATGLKRSILEGVKAINAEIKGKDAYKVKLGTKLDTSTVKGELQRAIRRIQAEAKGRSVKLNTTLAASDLKLELDEQSLKDVQRKIDHWRRQNNPVKLDVKLQLSEPNLRLSQARLAILTRDRTVSIFPMVNSAATAKAATALSALSGARVIGNYFDDIAESIGRLDKSTPIIGSLALAVAGLGAWGLTAASNLFALSSSLAQIGPAALALPGIFGGIAIGLTASIIAFRDIGKILPNIGKQWTALQKAVSNNFWENAAKPVRELVNSLFPQFAAGMAKVGTSLGTFFGGLATAITGSLNGELAGMFADLSKSIQIFTAATPAIANIIKVLGEVGAGYLPRLAAWVAQIATNFSTFLGDAAADGRLQGWIDSGIEGIKELGNVMVGLGRIFGGIAHAASQAGGSTLGMLGDTLNSVADAINQPAFQTGLIGVLSAAHAAMASIGNTAGPAVLDFFGKLAALLQQILPTVGATIGNLLDGVAKALSQPAVSQGLASMFAGIAIGVQGLLPTLAPVGKALGSLASVVGTFASVLGPLVAAAFAPLAEAVTTLAPAIEPLIKVLGGGLTAVAQGLAPVIQQLATAFAGLLSGGLLPALQSIVAALVPVIVQLAAALAPVVTQLVTGLAPILVLVGQFLAVVITALAPLLALLAQLLSAILTPLIPVLQTVAQELLPRLGVAITALSAALVPVVAFLVQLVTILMTVLAPAIQFIAGLLVDALIGAVNGAAQAINGLVSFIQGLIDFVVGVFTGDWSQAWNGIKEIISGVFDLIVGLIKVFWNIGVLKAFSLGLTAIKGLWKAGWEGIQLLGKLVWDGIKAAFKKFLQDIVAVPGLYLHAIEDLFAACWAVLKGAAGIAWQAIKSIFSTGVRNAVAVVKGLPGQAKAAIGDLSGLLVNAGKSLIEGFVKGITGMIGKVKDTLKGITSKLTSWKGPPSTDRTILTNAGQLVIEGFIDGLESRYDAVRKSLAGLTDDVAGTQFDAPAVGAVKSSNMSAAVQAALDGASGDGPVNQRVLNYYAAPNNSLDSEEDLFAAANRARGW